MSIGAFRRPVVGDRRGHPVRRVVEGGARLGEVPPESGRGGLDRLEQQGHDDADRLGRLAVEPIRKALAQADVAAGPVGVVPELRDHRRRAQPLAVGPPCDHERVAQRQDERPQLDREGHASPLAPASPASAAASSGARGGSTGSAEADPGQRVHARLDLPPQALAAEADRVVARQPGLGRGRRDDPARLVVVLDQRGVERHRDDLRRRDEAGHRLVGGDERAQRRDREPRLREVVEVVVGHAGLVDHDHGVRRRSMDQAERHAAVGRVVERALPLDDHPVAARLAVLDQPLDRALEEVGRHPVHRDPPALDHHPGLARGDEHDRSAGGLGDAPQLEGDGHLPDRAVRADREQDPLARQVSAPDRGVHALRRAPEVDQPDARRPGGLRQLRVVGEEGVQAGQDVEAGADRGQDHGPPVVGELAARGRDADQEPVGLGQEPERVVQRADDRDVVAARIAEPLPDVVPGLGRVDDRDHLVVPEPDHAHRGLAVMEAEVALGEDHEAALNARRHAPSRWGSAAVAAGIGPSLGHRRPRTAGSAPDVDQAPLQQPPLRIRPDEVERLAIGGGRLARPAGAPEELASGRLDQVVAGQVDLVERREARVGAVAKADRDGPVQGDDGVRRLEEGVVQGDDRGPVGLAGRGRGGVPRGDLGLEPVRPGRARVRASPIQLREAALDQGRGPSGRGPAPPSSAARRRPRPEHPGASAAAAAARGGRPPRRRRAAAPRATPPVGPPPTRRPGAASRPPWPRSPR